MDLRSIAIGVTSAINPPVQAQYYKSLGYATQSDGKRVPAFAPAQSVMVDKQDLSYKDLQHIDSLNLQGIFCVLYLHGRSVAGVNRVQARGGDKFVLNDICGQSQTWLVAAVPEQWVDWSRVIVVLQVEP